DRESRAGDELSGIPCLEVIDVRAVAVALFTNGVARSVEKFVGISRFGDDPARDVVRLSAGYRPTLLECIADRFKGGLLRVEHDVPDTGVFFGNTLADITHPC